MIRALFVILVALVVFWLVAQLQAVFGALAILLAVAAALIVLAVGLMPERFR